MATERLSHASSATGPVCFFALILARAGWQIKVQWVTYQPMRASEAYLSINCLRRSLLPAKSGDLIKAAEEVQWSRELLGIHYSSDNDASRTIGRYLIKRR